MLHDGGLGLGMAGENYLVRLESDVPGAPQEAHTPLEHARAWQRPGWFSETLTWFETLGKPVVTAEQVSTNDLACVLRVVTEQRTVYLKASETGLEATLTAQLAAQHPDLIPSVVAWNAERNVLVTQACGSHLSKQPELDLWEKAVEKLSRFQTTVDARELQALGCPVHDFTTLAERAETFLNSTGTLQNWGLTHVQTTTLQAQLPRISQAHTRVAALELPLLPAHGDPMNALTGGGTVWFDLSEACTAHPLLDIGWFLAGLSHPARYTLPLRQKCPDAAAGLWDSYRQILSLPNAAHLLNDVMVLALMHRALVIMSVLRDGKAPFRAGDPNTFRTVCVYFSSCYNLFRSFVNPVQFSVVTLSLFQPPAPLFTVGHP